MAGNTIDDSSQDYDDEDDSPTTPDRIPETIQPGRIGFTFWVIDDDGDEIGTDVIFDWDGEHDAEWYEDISPLTDGLSVMSSAPFYGTARWPNGHDVAVTYSSTEFRKEGVDVLENTAPISKSGDTRDVAKWTEFAQALVELVDSLTN